MKRDFRLICLTLWVIFINYEGMSAVELALVNQGLNILMELVGTMS